MTSSKANSTISKSLESQAVIEKLKVAELPSEQKLMEKRKDAEYKGRTLRIQQQLVKAKAHARILEEIDGGDKELLKDHPQKECEKTMQGYIMIWLIR